MEVVAGGDVTMIDAEVEGKSVGREEEARNRPEEARESGIARAVIARETRPKLVEEWRLPLRDVRRRGNSSHLERHTPQVILQLKLCK